MMHGIQLLLNLINFYPTMETRNKCINDFGTVSFFFLVSNALAWVWVGLFGPKNHSIFMVACTQQSHTHRENEIEELKSFN